MNWQQMFEGLNVLMVTVGFIGVGVFFAFWTVFFGYKILKKIKLWYYRLKFWNKTKAVAMAQYFYNFNVQKLSIPAKRELIRLIELDVEQQEQRYLKALGVR